MAVITTNLAGGAVVHDGKVLSSFGAKQVKNILKVGMSMQLFLQ